MASLIGSLYVSLTADFAGYRRNMVAAENVTQSTTGAIRRHMGLTERSVSQLHRSMNTSVRPYALIAAARTFSNVEQRANLLRGALFALTGAFGGLGAAIASNVVARYFDSFTGLENQIRVVADGQADLAAQIGAVDRVAARSRSSLSAVATLYSRMSKAAPNEGVGNTLRRVETITKALQLGGATAQEASSAAVQFSQAIASNRLGGEELRAVLETPLGLELAKGIGVTIGKLREMGYEGKLTADVLFKALDKISGSVNAKFANSIATIDQSLVVADNAIVKYAGSLDDTYGITRILTSGIMGFADSLETIVPLLATVGLGLGTVFAARRIGGGAGFLARPITGTAAIIRERRENLRLAKEEVAAAVAKGKIERDALVGARAAAAGDPRALAGRAELKQYQRDLAAVQKADAAHLGLIQAKQRTVSQLAEITRTATVGELKAAQQLAAQEQAVADAKARRAAASALLTRADKQAFGAMGGVDPQAAAKTKAVIRDIEREQTAAVKAVATEERRLADARAAVERERGSAYLATANQRAALLGEEKRMTDAIAASDKNRVALVQQLSKSRGAVDASGIRAGADALRTAEANAAGAARQLSVAGEAFTRARQAAGAFRIGLAAVGTGVGSLVGFLGGPWGVAFTVATAALAYFGLRAQQTAEQVRRAQQIISEELGKIERPRDRNEAEVIISDKILAETQRLRDVTARLNDIRTQVTGAVGREFGKLLETVSFDGTNTKIRQTFKILKDELESGALKLGDLSDRMRELGLSDESVEQVTGAFKDLITEGRSAEVVIENINRRIAALDGQRATVTVVVNTVDPLGIFSGTDPSKALYLDRAKQSAQYGVGQAAARDRIRQQQMRRDLLDAAGDVGDKARNTPAKIAAREQELLEQGYVTTREAARALAAEELNLAEANRKSSQSAGSAAKEYENFANKIAELRARAEASGLSELDQETAQFAEKLKNGSQMMRQYIDAVKGGDLSKAPAQLREVRDALLEIKANNAVTGILEQYGSGAQLAGRFAEQQEMLNIAVMNGDITAQQAASAWSDFLTQFGQYEWVDTLANSLTSFAESAIFDFENIGEATKRLVNEIAKLVVQVTLLEPLKNSLRNMFSGGSSLFGGGGGGLLGGLFGGGGSLTKFAPGILSGVFSGLFHGGGRAGSATSFRRDNAMAYANAPRFHSGLAPDEFRAILRRGEGVLTGQEMQRTAATVGGLARSVRSSQGAGGGWGDIHIDARGAQAGVADQIAAVMEKYQRVGAARVAADLTNARRRGANV